MSSDKRHILIEGIYSLSGMAWGVTLALLDHPRATVGDALHLKDEGTSK